MTWGEPFCITADEGHACSAMSHEGGDVEGARVDPIPCPHPARWYIEALGWSGPTDPPSWANTLDAHGCDRHLVELLDGMLS